MVQQLERPTLEVASNQVIVLGAGALVDPEQNIGILTDASVQRANRAARHYYLNQARFAESEAVIVCAGVSAVIGHEDIPEELQEGALMRDYLVEEMFLPEDIVKYDPKSVSTLTNMAHAFGLIEGSDQFIDPARINEENPLGLVTHQDHLARAIFLAAKLGIDPRVVAPIAVPENYGPKREVLSLAMYRFLMRNTKTVDDAIRVERDVIQPITRAAIPSYIFAKNGYQFVKDYSRLAFDTIF